MRFSSLQSIICIMGPTASGKSALGLKLAKKLDAEIISVDSTQIYRGLDIGTAKPSQTERAEIPHHLIDIRDPSEPYSAGDFCQDAIKAIESIKKKGKIPLLVGGTMLYYKALQQGLALLPTANSKIRIKIEKEAHQYGWDILYQRLTKIDPKTAAKIKPHDAQRIQRALEVYELTSIPLSDLQAEQVPTSFYQFTNIALIPHDREELRQRIERRFNQMIQQGLLAEVECLYQRGDLNSELPAIRAVGYRQLWNYLEGKISYDIACQKAVTATCQFAKRQLTWLRQWPNLQRYDSHDEHLINKLKLK